MDKNNTGRPSRRRTALYVTVATVVALAVFAGYRYGHIGNATPPGEPQTAAGKRPGGGGIQPVSVATVTEKDLRLWINAIGTAIPRNLVTVHARVDGELLRVNFTEGEIVKQGKLLAEIDPRPYQAQLDQAKGQLARDLALLQNAKLDLERYQDLWAKDSIAKQQVDTQAALVHQYEGAVNNDRGLVANANLQLLYTRISAPISGRVGLRQVDPGNQIHASDANGIVSIAQIEPMTVIFAIPEGQLPEITQRTARGEILTVEAWDREQKNMLAKGRLLTTDNQIDTTTGTIKLKAEFANSEHSLFANQFVNVRLLLGVRSKAKVVPVAALIRGARGAILYAVNEEGTVRSVAVKPGAIDGEEMEIQGEINVGERVVTDGGDKIRDGIKVSIIDPGKGQETAGEPDSRKGRGHGKRSDGPPRDTAASAGTPPPRPDTAPAPH
ncbi:MAG: MdtA/MuxA family multidrug efflux RND transporter periplasmic adaptor subunit [Betaproteobacteria bacterium]|nr:MdtA/MuxA family multidrug efflux RND transporter periplasmic adaptor subunit [Betaproteobacteria bacterium]